jgi:hypothetical protein
MKNKIKFFVVASILMLNSVMFAQFSRTDAIDLILNTVLVDDIGEIDVFAANDSFTDNVLLIDNEAKSNPYAEAWVLFSDDNPFASWYHSSRIIYVNKVDGTPKTMYNLQLIISNLQ